MASNICLINICFESLTRDLKVVKNCPHFPSGSSLNKFLYSIFAESLGLSKSSSANLINPSI